MTEHRKPSSPAAKPGPPGPQRGRFPRIGRFAPGLAVVFALAFAVRAANVAAIGSTPFAGLLIGDARAYDRWAQTIAAGDWIGKETFYQAPLYPYALGALYTAVGRDPMTIRWVQAVLGALACVLLALAGRRWLSARAGLVAGFVLALYPPAIFFDGIVQKSALDNLLLCALLSVLGAYAASGRAWLLPSAGAVLGLFALTRENALVFAVVIAVWLPFHLAGRPGRARAAATLLFVAGLALVLVPVGLRNLAVGGGFLITTSQSGTNFYIGNHEGANGRYIPIRPGHETPDHERTDATEVAEHALGRALTPGEVSSYWWSRALSWIETHPGDWLVLLGKKVLLTWNRAEIPDTESLEIYREYSPVLNALAAVFGFGVLLTLAAPGMIIAWRAAPRATPFVSPVRPTLLYLMLFVFSGAVAAFYLFGRYRFPMVPILTLFAAEALVEGFDAACASVRNRSAAPARSDASPPRSEDGRLRPQRRGAGAVLAAAGAGALLACLPPIVPSASSRRLGYVNLGIGFAEDRSYESAVTFCRKAIELAPRVPKAHYNLAKALYALGRSEEAVTELETTLRLDPRDADAHDELGVLLTKRGDLPGAERHFQEAHRIDPSRSTTLANLGSSALGQGRAAEAAEWYRKAIELAPGAASSHYYLAVALTELGRKEVAAAELAAALRLDPQYAAAHDDLGILLVGRGDLAGAEREFQDAYRIDPSRTSTLINLGSAALGRGRAEEAASWYRKALALKSDLTYARLDLVQALERLGRREEALREAREVLRTDPSNAAAAQAVARLR